MALRPLRSPRVRPARPSPDHGLRRRSSGAVLVLALALVLAGTPVAAQGVEPGVVCAFNPVPVPTRESRIFCEPLDSAGFVQFDQFAAGLRMLEEQAPDMVEVRSIGTSLGGLPIYFVEVTNEASPVPRGERLQLGYSASIHANEAAGREGMARVIEDLALGRGPHGASLKPLLDRIVLNVWFPNPDSWAAGDFFDADAIAGVHDPSDGTGFARGNLNGTDLNRQFPNPGWILPEHDPMTEPEARAVVAELRYSGNHSNLAAGADLHGMLGSPNMVRSIIPNQDYDFRRMVLIVEQLRLTQERVEQDPAFTEWRTADQVAAQLAGLPAPVPVCVPDPVGVVGDVCPTDPSTVVGKPFLWGARWDQIGYTDSGFTSDYLTLSPRSPTGGMGAVGTIVEFAYSHMVPDNKYVAKLTDMHVAGVRQIVRTQMEASLRLETPTLAGTGPVAFIDSGARVTSADDPNAYGAGLPGFDIDDPAARFDFRQVPYDVSNTDFWRDLAPYAQDTVERLPTGPDGTVDPAVLDGYQHLVVTDRHDVAPEAWPTIAAWVRSGGHLVLTDAALRHLEHFGVPGAQQQCVYIGHSDLEDRDHPLLADVDWNARVTAEASATGFEATQGRDWNYPQWGVPRAAFEAEGGEVVGTTAGHAGTSASCEAQTTDRLVTMGRLPAGGGRIDFIGAALPMPTQAYDHRYGLAPYSVSALTYWFFMNSLGGRIEWMPIDEPFVPTYPYDPLYGAQANAGATTSSSATPSLGAVSVVALLAIAAVALRRRR